MDGDSANVPVRSVETTLRLLELLRERDVAGVSELAAELGVAKSTVHNHLRTLAMRDYVVPEEEGFSLGFRFLDFGGHVRARVGEFRQVEPKIREIADETGEICQFFVRDSDVAVVVFMEEGAQAVNTKMRIGARVPLDSLTAGRLLRLFDDAADGDASDAETLDADGYLAGDEEYIQGLHSIAVPVTKTNDDLVGVLNVAGPARRLRDEEYERDVADLLLNVSNELELNVSYTRY
ncbi:IclR family transcriptional regulator [Halogeometricum luteum]|uniref:Helix-turn-helix domain-containing protein n=1 Tax=Halogeometricum luteum TaxID=2950537 RepID=A0ABU2G433_9EURY|nr:helix-turn-helix domain-containing protein [Halogeometricum sp. S3BR5-2]MDS0295552.1 helix-turn-helix domain-containing protein [Halogeometricum sp. S3BR5-2]